MNEKYIVKLLGWNLQLGFRVLMKEYRDPIYWHIRRITVNSEDAQDATQETFIRVFRSFSRFDRSQKILDLRKKYYAIYSTFLTQKQISRVYEIERDMMRRLSQPKPQGTGSQPSKPRGNAHR